MRTPFIVAILIATPALMSGQKLSSHNDPRKYPTLTNRNFVEKVDGKSIDFYLNHKAIDPTAKMFYRGEFAIFDDKETFAFLDSLLTTNVETRPFYLFIYNQAMKVTDGSIAENMSNICRRYLERYPCEFLANLNDNSGPDKDRWIGFVGFDIYDRASFDMAMIEVDKKVMANCPSRKSEWSKVKVGIEAKLEEK